MTTSTEPEVTANTESNPATLNEVLEEKVDFSSLPKSEKIRLQHEWIDSNIPEEDREFFKERGYTAPEMFGGKARSGERVDVRTPEEFKRHYFESKKRQENNYDYETKQKLSALEEQMKHVASMMKMTTSTTFEAQERDLNARMQKAKDEFDFETYDRLKTQQFEIERRKTEFNSTPKVEVKSQPQFSQEERNAIEDFRYSNADFVRSLQSETIRNSFDDYVKTTSKNRPDLAPQEVLKIAKKLTESVFPEIAPRQQSNNFMNTQSSTQSSTLIHKRETKPKIVFDQMSEWDRKFIVGAAKNYPGRSYQEVAELLASGIGKK